MLEQNNLKKSMTILKINPSLKTNIKKETKMSEGEDGTISKKIIKSESLNLIRNEFNRSENLLRMNESLNRLNELRDLRANCLEVNDLRTNIRNDGNEALRLSESLSVLRASDIIRTKDDKNNKDLDNKKMLPDDLRTNRNSNNNVPIQGSNSQQSKNNNISFSVASLLADTRPKRSPSALHSESPSPPVSGQFISCFKRLSEVSAGMQLDILIMSVDVDTDFHLILTTHHFLKF